MGGTVTVGGFAGNGGEAVHIAEWFLPLGVDTNAFTSPGDSVTIRFKGPKPCRSRGRRALPQCPAI